MPLICKMVQLSSPPPLDVLSPSEISEEVKRSSSREDSPLTLSTLQLALVASASTYQGYETYIEDGVICLKHKIRNIEKKKLKLEDYRNRLKNGETLNQDQMDAVEKYEEVVHNLKFARELQKTIDALSQDLLKAQRKAVRREQLAQMEAEQRRLSTVLHINYIMQNVELDHVRKDLRSGLNQAPFLSAPELEHLLELSDLLGSRRDGSMSLQDQMEHVSIVYWELLEGRDKPVAGTTYRHMKEQLARLMDSGYFDHIPVPHSVSLDETEVLVPKKVEGTIKPPRMSDVAVLNLSEASTKECVNRCNLATTNFTQGQPGKSQPFTLSWKGEFLTLKQKEPLDSWEMDVMDVQDASEPVSEKPFGKMGFVSKKQMTVSRSASEPKEEKHPQQRKKSNALNVEIPGEEFSSVPSLPNDPSKRKQQVQDLMKQIQGSFSFLQESMLECDGLSARRHSQVSLQADGTSSVDAKQSEVKSGTIHHPNALQESIEPSENGQFQSPPPFHSESEILVPQAESGSQSAISLASDQPACNSTIPSVRQPQEQQPTRGSHSLRISGSAPFRTMQTVFNALPPPRSNSEHTSDPSVLPDSYNMNFATVSTQTPADTDFQHLDLLKTVTTYQSECPVAEGCRVQLSPGQPAGTLSRHAQPYYPKGTVRGTMRGTRGLAHSCSSGGFDGYRTPLQFPGTRSITRAGATGESTPGQYRVQEPGNQMGNNHGAGAQRSSLSASWSSSSQVSGPEKDSEVIGAHSGRGVSRSATPIDARDATRGLFPQQMRVAFSAARTTNFSPGSLDQTITFDLLHCNLGEAFDVQMGRFICPVNGTYAFIFHILKLAVSVPLFVNLMRNEEVMVSAYANDGAPDHETASNHAVLQLYQGDRVWLRLHRGAIYSSNWKYSTFSGHLLYQD